MDSKLIERVEKKIDKLADKQIEKQTVTVDIDISLKEVLDDVKKYIKEISYDSLNPSYKEASKLLAYKIKKKGGLF